MLTSTNKGTIKVVLAVVISALTLWLVVRYTPSSFKQHQQSVDVYSQPVTVTDVRIKTSDYDKPASKSKWRDIDNSELTNQFISHYGEGLDNAIRTQILDSSLSRAEKIQSLWNAYQRNPGEAVRFLDWLRLLQPIELTDDLLIEFNNQFDPEVKKAILSLLGYATDYIDSVAINSSESDLEFIGRETVKIQNLYKNTALGSESELSRQALLRLPSLLPTEEMGQFLDLINSQYVEGKSVLSYDEIVGVWIETSLADNQAQETLLPKLLEHLNASENEVQDEAINARFYKLIEVAKMEEPVRNDVKKYIEAHEPKTSSPDLFYDWLGAYIKLSAGEQNADAVIEGYLLEGDARQQAGIVMNRSDGYLDQFTEEQMLRIVDSIGSGARQADLPERSVGQLKEALGILSQSEMISVSKAATAQLESLTSVTP